MNRNAARRANWTNDHLKEHWGLIGRGGISPFRRKQDFIPGASATLSEMAPRQLHNTASHPGGVLYIHTSRGGPDLTNDVIEALDGEVIPHWMMAEAYEHVRKVNNKVWLTVEALSTRTAGETVEYLADNLGVGRQAAYARIERFCELVTQFLDRALARIAGEETEGA